MIIYEISNRAREASIINIMASIYEKKSCNNFFCSMYAQIREKERES